MKINFKALDKPYFLCYSVIKLIETVDAEIKVIMLPQRARGAVSRVKNKSSNETAEGAVKRLMSEYSATLWRALSVGGMLVSC